MVLLQNMKFSKIKKWVALKIVLKFQIFDHAGPLKCEIWEKSRDLNRLDIFLKFQIFDHPSPLKHEFWQERDFNHAGNFPQI